MEPLARRAWLAVVLAAIGVAAALATPATQRTPQPVRWTLWQDRAGGDVFLQADGRLCLMLYRNDIGEEPVVDEFTGTWTPTENANRWRLTRHRRTVGIPEVPAGKEEALAPWSDLSTPEWAVVAAEGRDACRIAEASRRLASYVGTAWVPGKWPEAWDPCSGAAR